MPFLDILMPTEEPHDTRLEVLIEIFVFVLAGLVVLYALHLLVSLVLSPFLRGRARSIMGGYAAAGPFILTTLAVAFGLFVCQYIAIVSVFKSLSSPSRVFLDSITGMAKERGPEILTRIAEASLDSPDQAAQTAYRNYDVMRQSGYFTFLENFFRVTWRIHSAFDWVLLGILIAVMFAKLWSGTWALLTFPVRRQRGATVGELVRHAFGQLLVMFLSTVGVSVFFFLCAIGAALVWQATLWMTADLFFTYNAEILVSLVTQPISPGPVFTVLFSFIVMMLELSLLLMIATTMFSLSAARAIRMRCEKWCVRFLPPTHFEHPHTPRLGHTLLALGLYVLKVAIATLVVWAACRYGVVPKLGLSAGAFVAASLHLIAFNGGLWILRFHRSLRALFREWSGGLQEVRRVTRQLLPRPKG